MSPPPCVCMCDGQIIVSHKISEIHDCMPGGWRWGRAALLEEFNSDKQWIFFYKYIQAHPFYLWSYLQQTSLCCLCEVQIVLKFNSFLQRSLGVIVKWKLFRPLVANKEYRHLKRYSAI